MEQKTKLETKDKSQTIIIYREFNLNVNLLFKAFANSSIFASWMGTNVLQYEFNKFGGYEFESKDANGAKLFKAHGVFHEIELNKKIVRTFEIENSSSSTQLEFLEFEGLSDQKSKLTMHIVFKSIESRNELMKLPFAMGLNFAHNRLQEILSRK